MTLVVRHFTQKINSKTELYISSTQSRQIDLSCLIYGKYRSAVFG